jgi:hypothetical protein
MYVNFSLGEARCLLLVRCCRKESETLGYQVINVGVLRWPNVRVGKLLTSYQNTLRSCWPVLFNPLNAELNPICRLLVLLGDLTFMGPCIVSIFQYISNKMQRYSLFISGKCSTCFGWYFHPSSGAHTPVSTAHGICHTVTAICRYRGRVWTGLSPVGGLSYPQHTHTGSNSSTIAADSSNAVTNTRCCRYSCMRSWWRVEVPPETCWAVSRYK